MDRIKFYIFPTLSSRGSLNPYIEDFCKALLCKAKVVNAERRTGSATFDLLKSIFEADVYIFNWIENTPFKKLGFLQSLIFILFIFPILKIRGAKIYWVFHNFTSHQGNSFFANAIASIMKRYSDTIITHSKEALEYLNFNTPAKVKKVFVNHPIKGGRVLKRGEKKYDILIWGSIEPYKGILEFLRFLESIKSTLRINIIGKCRDIEYSNYIKTHLTTYITFENRIASFEEIGNLIMSSSFVLFPYLKQSISSSGALMDTISFGGSAIGPSRGAFLDMKNEGICYTFNDYDDIIKIVNSKQPIPICKMERFIALNTWESFANKILSL